MEVEQQLPVEYNDLTNDQIFTQPETQLTDYVHINEISVYDNHPDIAVTIYADRVVLRSSQPFTLRRYRRRLQINMFVVYYGPSIASDYEEYVSRKQGDVALWRRDAPSDQPLLTYRNRYHNEAYMASLNPAECLADERIVKRAISAYERYDQIDIRWGISGERPDLKHDPEGMAREEARYRALAEKWFVLGYADMLRRRDADYDMLNQLQHPDHRVALTEWTVWSNQLALRFFNRGECARFSVENRTLVPVAWPLGLLPGTPLLVPYDRPCVCFSRARQLCVCPKHCPSVNRQCNY